MITISPAGRRRDRCDAPSIFCERAEPDWERSGLACTEPAAAASVDSTSERSVILLLLVGGPSQLETWDPKPDAPADVRGPFRSIATVCPGVRISEHLPRMAARMDRLAIVRSVHHETAPIHETGYQLLQTGRLCRAGEEHPHIGSVVARLEGARNGLPPFVVVPGPIASTGVAIPHGQSAGWLGPAYEPISSGDYSGGPCHPRRRRPRLKRPAGNMAGPLSAKVVCWRDG